MATTYRIAREFRHGDVVYSPGEPLPKLTRAEVDALYAAGSICRADGSAAAPQAERILVAGDDVSVLREIRSQRAAPDVVEEVLRLALEQRRSAVLVEALNLALRKPC